MEKAVMIIIRAPKTIIARVKAARDTKSGAKAGSVILKRASAPVLTALMKTPTLVQRKMPAIMYRCPSPSLEDMMDVGCVPLVVVV
jgi:hypothetical protein